MIDWDKSAKLNDCDVESLKAWFEKYPSSGKRIVRICEDCNEEKEICFGAYRNLCQKCAMKQESIIEKLRTAANRQWSVPGAREAHSDYMRRAFIDGDERFEKQSKSLKQFYKENPDKLEEMSERAKQYHIDHPDVAEYHSRVMIENGKDPEYRKRASETRVEYLKVHPEFSVRMSEIMLEWNKDHPEAGKTHSEWMKNSDVIKANTENMVGGNDIVEHHFIYDHANPENHTVDIMRSEHTSHHNWMRRNGLEVPHLNEHILWRYV